MSDFAFGWHWVAGVVVAVLASVIPVWLLYVYIESYYED